MPTSAHHAVSRALADRLLGPGATRQDTLLAVGSASLMTCLILVLAEKRELDWSPGQWALASVLAFDLIGGVAVNASAPARDYYFGAGRGAPHHIAFVALHAVHVVMFSWLFRGGDWIFAGALSVGLIMASGAVLATPVYMRRAAAMLLLTLGIVLVSAGAPTPGMEWFVPVLLTKLLACYLLGDVPASARPTAMLRERGVRT